jgi:thiol-disulfide isomerase/thioredoxin
MKSCLNKLIAASVLAVLAAGLVAEPARASNAKAPAVLTFFYSPSCHRCQAAREKVMPLVEHHFSARLRVDYLDISEVENYKKLFTLKQKLGADEKSVFPVLYMTGKFIDGRSERNLTYESIASFVAQGMGREEKAPLAAATTEEVVKYFHKLEPLAIMSAGFADGINPCAFTVIVFFMSFLFFQGYTRRNIAVVGMSFMAAVFTTYVLLGFGLFAWLHVMKGFSLVTRIISVTIGAASIILGILSIYDAFVSRKKGGSEEMVLRLPAAIKRRVQMVIGDEYRVKKGDAPQRSMLGLVGSALAVGFIISIFESLCTGQLYLPTIMFILKTTPYKLHAFGYLVLYNLMFMIPIAVIYCFALGGVSSQAFAALMKKNMFFVKLFLAAMFLFLGVSLVHADNSMAPAGKPKAEIMKDPNFFDFGEVKEGSVIKHTFMLKNNDPETITIKEVNTSCACTTPKVGSKTVGPGKSVPIEISFDTTHYPGIRKRQLFVHTDSKTNPLVIFKIQADVK